MCLFLWNDGSFGTSGDSRILCQEAGIAAHHFNKENSFVRVSCVTNLIDTFHDGIERRIVAYGQVGAVQVVVDSTRQTYARHVELCSKQAGTSERAVATDDHEGVDAGLHHIVVGSLSTFLGHEVLGTGGLEYCAATAYDTRDALGGELLDFLMNKAFVASVNSFNLESVGYGCARHGAYGCVHAGGIASAGQNTDTFYLTCHSIFSLKFIVYGMFDEPMINRLPLSRHLVSPVLP